MGSCISTANTKKSTSKNSKINQAKIIARNKYGILDFINIDIIPNNNPNKVFYVIATAWISSNIISKNDNLEILFAIIYEKLLTSNLLSQKLKLYDRNHDQCINSLTHNDKKEFQLHYPVIDFKNNTFAFQVSNDLINSNLITQDEFWQIFRETTIMAILDNAPSLFIDKDMKVVRMSQGLENTLSAQYLMELDYFLKCIVFYNGIYIPKNKRNDFKKIENLQEYDIPKLIQNGALDLTSIPAINNIIHEIRQSFLQHKCQNYYDYCGLVVSDASINVYKDTITPKVNFDINIICEKQTTESIYHHKHQTELGKSFINLVTTLPEMKKTYYMCRLLYELYIVSYCIVRNNKMIDFSNINGLKEFKSYYLDKELPEMKAIYRKTALLNSIYSCLGAIIWIFNCPCCGKVLEKRMIKTTTKQDPSEQKYTDTIQLDNINIDVNATNQNKQINIENKLNSSFENKIKEKYNFLPKIVQIQLKSRVIGEESKRCKDFASNYDCSIYKPQDLPEGINPAKMTKEVEQLSLHHNKKWIQEQINDNIKIFDIGPNFKRRFLRQKEGENIGSEYYDAEREVIKKNPNFDGHIKIFENTTNFRGVRQLKIDNNEQFQQDAMRYKK